MSSGSSSLVKTLPDEDEVSIPAAFFRAIFSREQPAANHKSSRQLMTSADRSLNGFRLPSRNWLNLIMSRFFLIFLFVNLNQTRNSPQPLSEWADGLKAGSPIFVLPDYNLTPSGLSNPRIASLKIYTNLIRCLTRKSTRNYIALWLVKSLNIGVILVRRQGHGVRDEG